MPVESYIARAKMKKKKKKIKKKKREIKGGEVNFFTCYLLKFSWLNMDDQFPT